MVFKTREEEIAYELKRIKTQFGNCTAPIVAEGEELEELMLPMPDGVKLRTLIYSPAGFAGKPCPAVVVRTCYPKNDAVFRATAREYSRRGFRYIIQYCRGTGGSEGEWEPNVNERADGKATIDWVCARPDISAVGCAGNSYLALTGWVIADIVPEKVKTMYLTHYGMFRHVSAFQDGLFRHDVLTAWAMENTGFPVDADYLESCRYRPQVEVDEVLWGRRVDWYRKWVTSCDEDDAYWNTGMWGKFKTIPENVKIPLYIGEGWYDHHLGSAIETYKHLSPESRAHSTFLIGAWDHNFNVALDGRPGEHFENDDILRCFNWLYDILVKGEMPACKISSYIIGDDRWHQRSSYEIPDQKTRRFYLTGDAEKVNHLTEASDTPQGAVHYTYDPENPVATYGAESCLHSKELRGSLRQQKAGFRDDVLSFVSEPLTAPFTTMGAMSVVLNIASDAEDTAFAVKVIEEMPDGTAYHVRSSITTLGYRNHSKKRTAYRPGEKVAIEIKMWDLAWKFQQGSRIRVDVTSSDFPEYAVHSNYPGCWAEVRQSKPAQQTVFVGGSDSYVEFPLL